MKKENKTLHKVFRSATSRYIHVFFLHLPKYKILFGAEAIGQFSIFRK